MSNLQNILTGIRTLPNRHETEALEILSGLCAWFPKNTIASDAILDAIMVIEADVARQKASDALDAYIASPGYKRDQFAARSERGL